MGFRIANAVATCISSVPRLNCLGECGLPCGPQDALCTLRAHCSAIQGVAQSSSILREGGASIYLTSSFAYATLDTGGWLGLTRRGLSPRKRCQALPGAPATAITAACDGSYYQRVQRLCIMPREGHLNIAGHSWPGKEIKPPRSEESRRDG